MNVSKCSTAASDEVKIDPKVVLYSTPVYVIMCVVLIFFSLTTLTIIIKDYRLRNTSSPLFIANLALVDLLLAMYTMFSIFINDIGMGIKGIHVKVETLVEFETTVYVLISALSLFSTFANTVDRYIFIRHSIKYQSVMTVSRTKWIILSIWTFSIPFAFFPLIYELVRGCRGEGCPTLSPVRLYGNYTPLWVMYMMISVSNEVMFIILLRMVRKRRQSLVTVRVRASTSISLAPPITPSSTNNTTNPDLEANQPDDILSYTTTSLKLENRISTNVIRSLDSSDGATKMSCFCHETNDFKTAKTLFILLRLYIVLWGPSYIMMLLMTFYDIPLHRFLLLTYLFVIINSIIDFFVYPMRIRRIRTTFAEAWEQFRGAWCSIWRY